MNIKVPTMTLGVMLAMLVFVIGPATAQARSGSLDRSFGDSGAIISGRSMKSVVGAEYIGKDHLVTALSSFGSEEALVSVAYLTNKARPDLDFGLQGSAYSRQAGPLGAATDVAVAPNGSFYLGGWHGKLLGDQGYVISHFDHKGKPIANFGRKGTAMSKTRKDLALTGLDVQADGKAVASGGYRVSRGRRPAGIIMRFRKNGRPDKSFSGDGIAKFPVKRRGLASTVLMDVQVLADGKIVASGYSRGNVIAVKLKKNGKRDRSFGGGDGVVIIPRKSGTSCTVSGWCLDGSLNVASNGDLLILSNLELPRYRRMTAQVVRLTKDGKRRRSFGRAGVRALGEKLANGGDIVSRKSGKVIVAGSIKGHMGAIQLKKDGSIDKSFGKKGRVHTRGPETADSAIMDRKGRLTLAGGTGNWLKFVRYLP